MAGVWQNRCSLSAAEWEGGQPASASGDLCRLPTSYESPPFTLWVWRSRSQEWLVLLKSFHTFAVNKASVLHRCSQLPPSRAGAPGLSWEVGRPRGGLTWGAGEPGSRAEGLPS